MSASRSAKQIIKAIERLKVKLAKTRDELRDLEDEAQELRSISDDAVESLEYAISRLSEQV